MSQPPDLTVEMWSASRALELIGRGGIGLPDFQRRFVWSVNNVRAYLSTLLAGLPSGNLLVAENGKLRVSLRELASAPPLEENPPHTFVLLDGQQRLTALYQAVAAVGPERYAVDFTALIEGSDFLQDEVVVSVPARKWDAYRQDAWLHNRALVPISALVDSSSFFSWLNSLDITTTDNGITEELLGDAFAEYIHPIGKYQIPVTRLGENLELPTVALVFERTNKSGVTLDAFDLLVARLQSSGWNLRDAWNDASNALPELMRVFGANGLPVISAISMLLQSDVRRSAMLSLPPSQVAKNWDAAIIAASEVARMLLDSGVRRPDLMPYDAISTTMIACRMGGVSLPQLQIYFWLAGASSRYESASNTTAVSDFRLMASGEPFERVIEQPGIQIETIERNTRRSSKANWAILTSLLLTLNPLDLTTGQPISSADPYEQDNWEMIPFFKGGHSYETESDVPMRLRTAGQLFSHAGRRNSVSRLGFTKVVSTRFTRPELFGPSIDECLTSQLLPHSDVILGGIRPEELVRWRSEQLYQLLLERTDTQRRSL